MNLHPVAILTGAGSGIGQVACALLAEHGYRIALVGRDRSKLQQTSDLIAERFDDSHTIMISVDVGQPDAAKIILDQTIQEWGWIDVLINNAAFLVTEPLPQTSLHTLRTMFEVNVFGPAQLIAGVWPIFVRQRFGCVVNVSSMSTVDPFPGLSAYAASKAALESLTRSVMSEGRQHGMRAFSIAPGAVETAMLRQVVSENDLPTQRTLTPLAVAQVIFECVCGDRDGQMEQVIHVPSP